MASNKQAMVEKYGSLEAYKQHMRDVASKPRPNGGTGGYAKRPDLAVIHGKKSKRNKAMKGEL